MLVEELEVYSELLFGLRRLKRINKLGNILAEVNIMEVRIRLLERIPVKILSLFSAENSSF